MLLAPISSAFTGIQSSVPVGGGSFASRGAFAVPTGVSTARIDRCSFRGNQGAKNGASAISVDANGFVEDIPATVLIVDSSIIGNGPGTPFFSGRDAADIRVESSDFRSNTCSSDSGGFENSFISSAIEVFSGSATPDGARVTLRRSLLEGNRCAGGSALKATSVNVTVDDCVFARNHADFIGAAILVEANLIDPPFQTVSLARSEFIGNDGASESSSSADQPNTDIFGGGAVFVGRVSELFVEDCSFTGNIGFGGGAIKADASVVQIQRSRFHKNAAVPSQALTVEGAGGALELTASDIARVTRSRFRANSAASVGGAIEVAGTHAWCYTVAGAQHPAFHLYSRTLTYTFYPRRPQDRSTPMTVSSPRIGMARTERTIPILVAVCSVPESSGKPSENEMLTFF